jgi:predicted nucleotidyltransferase
MVDRTIVKSVRQYLKTVQEEGIAVRFGVVFGSYATGRSDPWSDIDVLVVSPVFDAPRNRQDIDRLWRLAARSDNRIVLVDGGALQKLSNFSWSFGLLNSKRASQLPHSRIRPGK